MGFCRIAAVAGRHDWPTLVDSPAASKQARHHECCWLLLAQADIASSAHERRVIGQ
jgi:hypothetical protein